MLLSAIGVWVTIEQPGSSLLQYHNRLQQLMTFTKMYLVRFDMWYFEASTLKPTALYSNRRWISEILEYQVERHGVPTRSLVDRWVDKLGRVRFRGNSELKRSQALFKERDASVEGIFARSFVVVNRKQQIESCTKVCLCYANRSWCLWAPQRPPNFYRYFARTRALHATQQKAYPDCFGDAMAKLYIKHRGDLLGDYRQIAGEVHVFDIGASWAVLAGTFPPGREGWRDADLFVVFERLRSGHLSPLRAPMCDRQ